jgi:hypothetical protein
VLQSSRIADGVLGPMCDAITSERFNVSRFESSAERGSHDFHRIGRGMWNVLFRSVQDHRFFVASSMLRPSSYRSNHSSCRTGALQYQPPFRQSECFSEKGSASASPKSSRISKALLPPTDSPKYWACRRSRSSKWRKQAAFHRSESVRV